MDGLAPFPPLVLFAKSDCVRFTVPGVDDCGERPPAFAFGFPAPNKLGWSPAPKAFAISFTLSSPFVLRFFFGCF